DRFSMLLVANRQKAIMDGIHLQLPHSVLRIDTLTAHYDADHLEETICYTTSLNGTTITPSDLSCLIPDLKGFNHAMAINATIEGSARHIDCQKLVVRSDNDKINLTGTFSAQQQDSLPVWQTHIHRLDLTGGIIAELKEGFDAIPIEATRLGNLHLSGDASGRGLNDIDTRGLLVTEVGKLSLAFALTNGQQFKGHLNTDSIHLGKILNETDLGHLSTQVDISGTPQRINAIGQITRLDYKGYTYRNITLDGNCENGNMSGTLKINDPNLQLDAEGSLKRQQRSAIRFTGIIKNISPKALQLTDKWDEASFAAIVDADFTASSLNDAEGNINLNDFY
ncbi:MAG: hypothetical protein K2O54_05200, partial [Prevotella sp.]|nr:hypothetical protein [Prevotella sp.]